jgi:hypothetical protein
MKKIKKYQQTNIIALSLFLADIFLDMYSYLPHQSED